MEQSYGFTIAVTAVALVVGVALLTWKQSAAEKIRREYKGSERAVKDAILVNVYDFFKLGCCYTCGKAFQAMVLGGFSDLACMDEICVSYWLPIIVITVAFASLFSYVNAQYEFSETAQESAHEDWPCCGRTDHIHGQFCVCVFCVPDAYPVTEFPGHDKEDGITKRAGPLDYFGPAALAQLEFPPQEETVKYRPPPGL